MTSGIKNLYPKIPSLCLCGCNEIVWNGNRYIGNHRTKLGTFLGKHHSDIAKHKMSIKRANNPIHPMRRPEIKQMFLGNQYARGSHYHHTDSAKKRIGDSCRKEKHYLWRGGSSFLPYCSKFNNYLKDQVRIRDNHTCQLCNTKENGRKLDVHHIHHDRPNCYPDLISLCRSCHSKVNIDKNQYESLFMNILNERQLLFWTKEVLK